MSVSPQPARTPGVPGGSPATLRLPRPVPRRLLRRGAAGALALALAGTAFGTVPGAGAAPASSSSVAVTTAAARVSVPAAPAATHARTTANLHLRAAAGTQHASLGIMPKGTVVARTGKVSGTWWQVRHGAKTGWASSTYLVAAPAPAKPAPASTARWFGGSQALYAQPTFASKRLQAFTKGTRATLVRASGAWSYVKAPGSEGWVPTRDLSTTATVYTGATILPSSTHRWALYRSNVRTGPSTATRSLGVVPAGEMMPLLASRNGWSQVKTSRGTGWIKGTLVTNLATKAPAYLQPVTARMLADVKARHGGSYGSVGTLRNGSIGHRLGLGADFMVKGWNTAAGIRNGDAMAAYLVANHRRLGVDYIIWRDRIWLSQDGQWGPYSKGGWGRHLNPRGWNATTMHFDHLHVETKVG
ncbi:SH3 domain-containing protein [Zafaria sp. Z1313]|uniref:SH3 domain-containing protein n=1 Tax=unclassified Zafaria TaxID=2828765 RepID=UPI002E790253|nr:SH3 domain-containing protein [Zafaria sp. J156]MEE1621565.1 SH3 domain-containing protein [Zafaria sp. J156]